MTATHELRLRPWEHRLDWDDFTLAIDSGIKRQLSAIRDGRQDAHGFDGFGWGEHIEGCASELCFARITSQEWDPKVGLITPGDVGDDIEIRCTKHERGHMIVYESNPTAHRFVLATGTAPQYWMRGWLPGVSAKAKTLFREKREGGGAFWVPQSALIPMSEFKL
jgi:hypothetical protein